jgi:hypothetical protein
MGWARKEPEFKVSHLFMTGIRSQQAVIIMKGGVLPRPLFKHATGRLGPDGVSRIVLEVGVNCPVSMTLKRFRRSSLTAPRLRKVVSLARKRQPRVHSDFKG